MIARALVVSLAIAALGASATPGEISVTVDRNRGAMATGTFKFDSVSPPSVDDAAAGATVTVAGGRVDTNSAPLAALTDGKGPSGQDEPGANFFFGSNTWGGRLVMDLGRALPIRQINTYSWHWGPRGPQLYNVYGSAGTARGFDPAPKSTLDPVAHGWTLIAFVDTRDPDGGGGGQYGVSIADRRGNVGTWRYLLFDVFETESDDAWGQTFYSEIDVIR